MDDFDPSDPFSSLSQFMHDDDFQRYIDSLNSDNLNPLVSLLPPLPPPNEVPVQLSDALQYPTLGSLGINCEFRNLEASSSNANQTELVNPSLVPPPRLDCSGCHLLREVVHTNGLQNMKLAIHGRLGVFYHATLEVNYNVDGTPPVMEPSYIDFCTQSFQQVKQFLIDYGLLRMRDRYVVMHDSLSGFYDALCVRMNYEVANTNTNGSQATEQGLCQSRPTVAGDDLIRAQKTGIAAQRERTANLHLSDFADYFHLPIVEAAKEIRICSTVLKKICRKYGMARWPYRKVKSIDDKISKLQKDLLARGGQGAVSTQAEIRRLRAQRAKICQGLPP